MTRKIELLACYWTLAGDCYPMGSSEAATFPLRDRVEAAAAAGYTGLGLVHQDLVVNAKTLGYPAMRRLFDDHGIAHLEVEIVADWFETGQKKAASDRVRKDLLEAAHELSARDIKCIGEIGAEACDVGKFGDAFASLCADARAVGAQISIEILPMSNLRTLETAKAVVERAGEPNGGLCLDIWHFVRGGIAFDEIATLPPSMIKFVEINDAAAAQQGSLWDDTLFHRLFPGEGSFDCPGFIDAIERAGFRGFYGVEILSQTYRKLPLREQAEQSFAAAMAQFAKAQLGD
jgi:sugar phosphate isomerase/epimerase